METRVSISAFAFNFTSSRFSALSFNPLQSFSSLTLSLSPHPPLFVSLCFERSVTAPPPRLLLHLGFLRNNGESCRASKRCPVLSVSKRVPSFSIFFPFFTSLCNINCLWNSGVFRNLERACVCVELEIRRPRFFLRNLFRQEWGNTVYLDLSNANTTSFFIQYFPFIVDFLSSSEYNDEIIYTRNN